MKMIKSLYNYLKESISSNKLDESSILSDVEDTLKAGDSFADLQYWIDNFKNLDAMGINVSNFIKEIKKHGAKPLHDTAVENGKYFVRIVHDYSKAVLSYNLTFFYPVENEMNYWHYAIIHMEVPKDKRQERRGYKKEIRILDNHTYKVSDTYIKQEITKTLSSRTRKMYSLPDKYKGIINLIKIEDKK